MMSIAIRRRAAMLGPLVLAGAILTATSPADAATKCGVGSGEGYGYTYLTSLTVTRTTCTTGKSVVRHRGGVAGWHCSNKVLDRSPVQYDARMTCTSGSRRVVFGYTQNT
jgi:hypothetical protein